MQWTEKLLLWVLLAGMLVCGCGTEKKESEAPVVPAELQSLPDTAELKAGDIFTFGRYEQDNDLGNGAEPIEWQVLAVENGNALVISKYALDVRPYNDAYINVTWRTSALRKWLNGEFYTGAFNPAERSRIAEVENSNPKNPSAGTMGGLSTKDRIFLLSIGEADQYFADDEARLCEATVYAKANGAYTGENGNSWWWLRSPGRTNMTASLVLYVGYVTHLGYAVSDPSCVIRPAFWLRAE